MGRTGDLKSVRSDLQFRLRYETLRSLLDKNGRALQLLSDLEADLGHFLPSDHRIRRPLRSLCDTVLFMAQELNLLTGDRQQELYQVLLGIAAKIESLFEAPVESSGRPLAVRVGEPEARDPDLVGGKAAGVARLAELFPDFVRPGFVITTAAYRRFLESTGLVDRIRVLFADIEALVGGGRFAERTRAVRELVRGAPVPDDLVRTIDRYAAELAGEKAVAGWAVRSSATSEDGRFSFAGQFDSLLKVRTRGLVDAYRAVVASRFTDRAVIYRLHCGFSEVETPMAVLFMPMVDPVAAGVIYTRDPRDPSSATMVVRAVPGLGDVVVRGSVEADVFVLSREFDPRLVESRMAPGRAAYLSESALGRVGNLALKAAEGFGHEMDVEWAIDACGAVWLLQGRRLAVPEHDAGDDFTSRKEVPLVEGGITIFPGRSEGAVFWLTGGVDPALVPKGCVLVVEHPTPEVAAALPRAAAVIAVGGNPVGHLAALLREFGVPSIFGVARGVQRLVPGTVVSVDATTRRVYEGSRWSGVRESVLRRIETGERRTRSGPLHELVASFHMTDPYASAFKAGNCRSLHDAIRFIHEMSVRSVFGLADEQARKWPRRKSVRVLHTHLPLRLRLIDLDGSVRSRAARVLPEEIASYPFQALWRGISDIRLPWPERWETEFGSLPAEFREAVFGAPKAPRRRSDANYALVAADYLNFNARFAYHYAMIDAIVAPGEGANHVHFRHRGGGAADANRERRARFLEIVLRRARFGVDRQGDLVAAWLRRYPQRDCEEALELVGRLMVCARQLDLLMRRDEDVDAFVTLFCNGEYRAFS